MAKQASKIVKSKVATKSAKQAAKSTAKRAPDNAESTAWNKGKTMTLHLCKVGGKTYRSVWDAWQQILGPKEAEKSMSKCVRFRKKLKESKGMRMETELPNGKKYTFALAERE